MMMSSVRLGRIAGIPLRAHWSALVLPLLIADLLATGVLPATVKGAGHAAYWVAAAAVAVAFLVSLCAHELAHAVVARRKGLPVRAMTLWMLGGVTTIDGEATTPTAELEIAIAGPATSLACAVVSGAVAGGLAAMHGSKLAIAGAAWLAATNVLLAVFNMLPGAPLDGGRVLSALLWRRSGDRARGRAVAARAGRTTGVVLMCIGGADALATGDIVGGMWLAVIGWFLTSTAVAEAKVAQAKEAFVGVDVASVMDPDVTTIPVYQSVGVAARRAVEADADLCLAVTFEGALAGVVDVDELLRAVQADELQPVSTVTHEVPAAALTTPDSSLLDAVDRARGRLPLVVLDQGAIVGVVTATAINHALRRQLVHPQPVG